VTLRLVFTPKAEADLASIWAFTAERWSATQAERYLTGLGDTLALFRAHPEIARRRTEFTPPVRLHPYRSHVVIFTADEEALEVIRVVHMRADWAAVLSE
jgi:toxin ParE1/3/4